MKVILKCFFFSRINRSTSKKWGASEFKIAFCEEKKENDVQMREIKTLFIKQFWFSVNMIKVWQKGYINIISILILTTLYNNILNIVAHMVIWNIKYNMWRFCDLILLIILMDYSVSIKMPVVNPNIKYYCFNLRSVAPHTS